MARRRSFEDRGREFDKDQKGGCRWSSSAAIFECHCFECGSVREDPVDYAHSSTLPQAAFHVQVVCDEHPCSPVKGEIRGSLVEVVVGLIVHELNLFRRKVEFRLSAGVYCSKHQDWQVGFVCSVVAYCSEALKFYRCSGFVRCHEYRGVVAFWVVLVRFGSRWAYDLRSHPAPKDGVHFFVPFALSDSFLESDEVLIFWFVGPCLISLRCHW